MFVVLPNELIKIKSDLQGTLSYEVERSKWIIAQDITYDQLQHMTMANSLKKKCN